MIADAKLSDEGSATDQNPTGRKRAKKNIFLLALRNHGWQIAGIIAIGFAAVGASLFDPSMVISSPGGDVASQYLYLRGFAAKEILGGNFPLWNPMIYSGVPMLGDFQAALLYPPNLIFLLLPLSLAITWSFASHLALLGCTTYAWALVRGAGRAGAFFAGSAIQLAGAVFPHIYAGHLSNLCSMAWMPLVFLGIERWLQTRKPAWVLCASGAAALQIYAGHVQYAYFGAIAAALFALFLLLGQCLKANAPEPSRKTMLVPLMGLLAIYPLAAAFAAAQILPGFAALAESVRGAGTPYEFASMFSFPPENALTIFAPQFFGAWAAGEYWGRCYLWEMSAFMGTGGLLLALYGLGFRAEERLRWLFLLAAIAVLALGKWTPLHALLYDLLPGFSSFRGASKFWFFGALFLAVLGGAGVRRLLDSDKPGVTLAVVATAFSLALFASGRWLASTPGEVWFSEILIKISQSGEIFYPQNRFQEATAFLEVWSDASASLLRAALFFCLFALLWLAARRSLFTKWLLIAASLCELLFFARSASVSFSYESATYAPLQQALQRFPGDFRILNLLNPNSSMLIGREGIWGYDPNRLRRYSRLLLASQGADRDAPDGPLLIERPHPVLDLFRLQHAVVPSEGGAELIPAGKPFPRFFVVGEYEVFEKVEILNRLIEPTFDLREKVLLESEPAPRPSGRKPEFRMRLTNTTPNFYEMEVAVDTECLLLVTDAFAEGWRVDSLPGNGQLYYDVLPANYAMRAIPLAAGPHKIRLRYSPPGLDQGFLLSALSLLAAAIYIFRRPLLRKLGI